MNDTPAPRTWEVEEKIIELAGSYHPAVGGKYLPWEPWQLIRKTYQTKIAGLERELAEAQEQRDRLVETLERWPEVREWLEMSDFVKGYMKSESGFFNGLSAALAAVKPNVD